MAYLPVYHIPHKNISIKIKKRGTLVQTYTICTKGLVFSLIAKE